MLKIQKASAGSGKTFALTGSYIKLLLGEKRAGGYRLAQGSNRHRAILAITFTNKATEEMKARIVKQLALLADINGKSDYRAGLCRELHCSAADLSAHAAKALDELLADFGSFNISTIDAFFQMVLRTFAREANLSGNYEVELDQERAVFLGVNAMLSSINADDGSDDGGDPEASRRRRQLMAWLRQYMMQQLDEGKSFNLFVRNSNITKSLVAYIKSALNETYKLNAEAIGDYLSEPERVGRFSAAVAKALARLRSQLQQLAEATIDMVKTAGALEGVNAHVRRHFLRWSNDDIDTSQDIIGTILNVADDPRTAFTKRVKNPSPDLVEAMGMLATTAAGTWQDMRSLRVLSSNIFHLGIIGEVERRTAEVQRDNNTILLGDTGTILQAIINQEEAPFIYERLGVRLRHFLIDEFQDTSRLQWLNLSPLVRESLATDNDNLIIGDEKQAIYRFRNSDPTLIVKDVPEEFAGQAELHGNAIEENTNWRSAREVVQFNNTLFLALARRLGLSDIYANVVQQIHHSGLPGYVELAPYSGSKGEDDSLDRMVAHMRRQLAAGYRQRDIAVLCSRRVECQKVVARLLDEKAADQVGGGAMASLRVITDEALVVANASSVRLIVGVLRYVDSHVAVDHSRRTTAATTAAELANRYEFFRAMGSTATEAMALAFSDRGAEADAAALEAAEMECVNLSSIVERIVARCVSDQARSNDNLYISAFQDMVVDFCSWGSADLHSFMKWWDEIGSMRSLTVPEAIDGIRVMTIHKSKGLEFACVHVPLLSGKLSSPRNMMWVATRQDAEGALLPLFRKCREFDAADVPPLLPMEAPQVAKVEDFADQYAATVHDERVDRLNQIYVAFTRASRELLVGYNSVSSLSEVGAELLAAIAELTPEAVVAEAESRQLPPAVLVALSDKMVRMAVASKPAGEDAAGEDGSREEQTQYIDLLVVGAPTVPEEARSEPIPEAMPAYYSYDNDEIWAMSRVEDLEERQSPRQQGIVLHAIMGYVGHASDVGRAVMRAHMRGLLPAAEVEPTAALLRDAMADWRVARWFGGYRRLLRERSITLRSGELLRYRPDRVVWTADDAIEVVDYKFGEEEPSRYRRQVRGYMSLLRRAYPGATVRGFLWYPLTSTVVEVSSSSPSAAADR